MTYELKLEHTYDARPEAVYETLVAPDAQGWLHGAGREGWTISRAETDVRVGGTSVYAMGRTGDEPDTETRVYTVVDPPHRLEMHHRMDLGQSRNTVETELTITVEEREDKTVVTMFQTGFDDEEMRDAFIEGWTEYLNTLGSATRWRLEHVHEGRTLKVRHDS